MENINIEPAVSDIDSIIVGALGTVEGEELGNTSGVEISEEEKKFRGLQSKYDQLSNQYNTAKAAQDLWAQFAENPEIQTALIAKVRPELFKVANPQAAIRESLATEFGETFEDLLENGTSFQKLEIQQRYQELKNKSITTAAVPKSWEQIMADNKVAKEAEAENFIKERQDTMNTFKWSEEDWNAFGKWSSKVKMKDLGYIFNRAKSAKKIEAPSIFGVGSGSVPTGGDFAELDKVFGKKPKNLF